jgi:hypothetical protein
MMEFISNLAQDKVVAPTAICEEGHTEATANKPPKDSPMPPPSPTGWTRYTTNWRRSMPSPLHN